MAILIPTMAKPAVFGFVYGAVTPVVLAAVAAIFFTGGNLTGIPIVLFFAALISAPVSIAFTVIFGIPIYRLYRQRRVTSFSAYTLTGLGLSLPVAAFLVWSEYSGSFENANQALLSHTIQFVCLISGPAAAAMFWRTVRPDVEGDVLNQGPNRKARAILAVVCAGLIAFVVYGTANAPKNESKMPLKTERVRFDSTKSPDLIVSLKSYATSRDAHLGYWFMQIPQDGSITLMTQLTFPDGTEIIATNSAREELISASVYANPAVFDKAINQLWPDFILFLRSAADHANALPADELPDVPSAGEGGRIESKWWDWRFNR